jgi:hypothetical protein
LYAVSPGVHTGAPEDRHHDQPSIGKLVISHDRIAIVPGFTRSAESPEHGVVRNRAVQHSAGRVVPLALLREDRETRVHGLHDVIRADREAVIRRVAAR